MGEYVIFSRVYLMTLVMVAVVTFAGIHTGSVALAQPIAPSDTLIVSVNIVRISGVCPHQIRIRRVTNHFEGGYTVIATVIGTALVARAEIVSATAHRIELRTFTRDPYRTCSGKGTFIMGNGSFAFILSSDGIARFIYRPGTGPNGTPPVLTEVGGPNDLHVRASFSD